MTLPSPALNPRASRLSRAIGVLLLALAIGLPGGVAATPAATPGASPVTVVTPADQGLVEQLSSDDDVILVVGVTAVTLLGLTGLAVLDRRPELPDHEAESLDQDPEDIA